MDGVTFSIDPFCPVCGVLAVDPMPPHGVELHRKGMGLVLVCQAHSN